MNSDEMVQILGNQINSLEDKIDHATTNISSNNENLFGQIKSLKKMFENTFLRTSQAIQKWEYKIDEGAVRDASLNFHLNHLGMQGWELVAVTIDNDGVRDAYLKRPLEDEEN